MATTPTTHNILLTIDVDKLREGKTPSGWCQLTQDGSTKAGNPTDVLLDVNAGDTIIWSGIASPLPGTVTGPQPIVDITGVAFASDSDCFDHFPLETHPEGGSIYSVKAKSQYPNKGTPQNIGPIAYTVSFVIRFNVDLLDPKIRVTYPA